MKLAIRSLCTAVLFIAAASVTLAHMGVTKTEPEDGAILDKAPEAVQVWYTQEPDAAVSKVSMSGPNGEVALFVHPGKDKSLMGMVQDKDLADGEYVVKWQTSGDGGHIQKGEYKFTLKSSH